MTPPFAPEAEENSSDAPPYELLFDLVEYGGFLPDVEHALGTLRGVLVLGPIPTGAKRPLHPLVQHHKGVLLSKIAFERGGMTLCDDGWPYGGWKDLAKIKIIQSQHIGNEIAPVAVRTAYKKAREARFEHGERPKR